MRTKENNSIEISAQQLFKISLVKFRLFSFTIASIFLASLIQDSNNLGVKILRHGDF